MVTEMRQRLARKLRQPVVDNALSGGGTMGELIRSLDWSKTSLGAVGAWPQSLKTSVSICINSRFPVLIWWGPDLVKIYNDAYIQLIGTKHPGALGSSGRVVWPEIWNTIGPLLAGVMERGEANWADDLLLLLERNGYPEECYFTFSYSPIRDESGGIGGVFTPVVETTERVIGERRLRTLRDLAMARSHRSRHPREACTLAARRLSANPFDLPYAAIYLFDEDGRTASLATAEEEKSQEPKFPAKVDFRSPAWLPIERLMPGEHSTLQSASLGLKNHSSSAWGCPVEESVAVPISIAQGEAPVGFLLAGISPRKRLDDNYSSFYTQIAEELGEAIRGARMVGREAELLSQQEAERAKLGELFQQAPAAIMMLQGAEHKVVMANSRYVRLLGRKDQNELIGKPLAEALPEIVGQGFVEKLDEVFRTGKPFAGNEMKARLEREESGQDEVGYFNFVYQPTRDGTGRVDGILIHAVEVSEQVRARLEIESREEQFRVLADSIPQLAWMGDPSGDLFWFNRRWYEYTGTTLEEMRGWGWQSVHDQNLLPEVVERYKQSLATGHPFSMTFPLRGADGRFRTFLTLALPVRDSSGKVVRWFGTNTDIEAQRKTEEALRQSEKLAAVGRLASSIAHEINNPLEAVINLIYLAKASTSNDEVKAYLESADAELGRVAQITSQTLRFHKQQSAPAVTDVVEVVNSILMLYRRKLSHDGVNLKLDVRECSSLVCYAGEIRQVLANLIGNALDAMSHGGVLRVKVREGTAWQTAQRGVRITVADTGHGMTAQTMERLYEPFFTTKEAFGTGLGLWVSAGIVKKHGGSILARSSVLPGKSGTVFTVFLPYAGVSTL